MRWPGFWSSSPSQSDGDLGPKNVTNAAQTPGEIVDDVLSSEPPKKAPSIPHSTDWSSLLTVTPTQLFTARENILPTIVLTSTCLAFYTFYRSYLRRIPAAGNISPEFFRNRSLVGRVTSVGDGDNFRIFHTPGGRLAGWGWMPRRRVPTERKGLKDKTIHIRLAGVDAPELPHFGRPAQPYSQEALNWLREYVLNRRVRAYIYKRDQYDRVVATVYVRKGILRRDVGLQMLKAGLATVYEAKSGAEFGVGLEEKYRKAEWWAKWRKRGIWSGNSNDFESPREYKTRHGSETSVEQTKSK